MNRLGHRLSLSLSALHMFNKILIRAINKPKRACERTWWGGMGWSCEVVVMMLMMMMMHPSIGINAARIEEGTISYAYIEVNRYLA